MKTTSNVLLVSGIALCVIGVWQPNLDFISTVNAADCYVSTITYCPGYEPASCPTRCQYFDVLWVCGTIDGGLITKTAKEINVPHYDDSRKLTSGFGNKGRLQAESAPCELSGDCGCKAPDRDDPNRNYVCTSPQNYVESDNAVEVTPIDPESEGCSE